MQQGESYYQRYCRMGKRFVMIGGAIVLAAVLLGTMGGLGDSTPVLFVGTIGGMLFLFGAVNMRPANRVKTFAAQLQRTPETGFAKGLLEAMEDNGKTRLTGRSKGIVEAGITAYAASEGADEELAAQLKEALEKRIGKVFF